MANNRQARPALELPALSLARVARDDNRHTHPQEHAAQEDNTEVDHNPKTNTRHGHPKWSTLI